MKNNSRLVIVVIMLFATLTCFVPNISADPSVMISAYSLSPEILLPGDTAELTVTISNGELTSTRTSVDISGSDTTTTVKTIGATLDQIRVIAASSGTFQIYADQYYNDVGDLAPGASISITFKLKASNGMPEGIYFPKIKVDVAGAYEDVLYPIPVKISNATIDLLSTEVPSKISESGSTQITFTAVNNRDSTVNNIVVTPKKIEGVEFTPESVFIESIDSDSSEDISFSLKPNEKGVKNLSFDISYKNGDNIHTSSINKTIEIINTLDVGSIFTSLPKSIKKGESARITLEVYNAKTESITGVMVTPLSDTTILPSQYFIGAMDSDDVFSASFDIFTDDLDYGNHTIEFEVSFKQGTEYFKTPTISTTFSVGKTDGSNFQRTESSSTETQLQPDIVSACLPIILIIIIIVVVLLVWKWKKRRNSE